MGLSVLNQPAAAGGGIKSVQRGSAAGAGNVTITSVDIAKSFVTVFGTTSSGTVAASGTINAASGNINAANGNVAKTNMNHLPSTGGNYNVWPASNDSNTAGALIGNIPGTSLSLNSTTFSANSTTLTGGSNNLVAAVVQGYLSNSTTLVVSGACRWEVVEFN